jgi:hypothetical protein
MSIVGMHDDAALDRNLMSDGKTMLYVTDDVL